MNYKILLSISIIILIFNQNISAQALVNEEQPQTINNQFDILLKKSGNYQDYKVVKKASLYNLKTQTLDSIKALQANLIKLQIEANDQTKDILDLKNNLSDTQNTLAQTIKEKDSISFLGIILSKQHYGLLLWSIIAVLFCLLGLFIYKFKNSNILTKKAQQALSETEKEFEEHRRRALEREQKVRRQLQDEINKKKTNN